jgi:hypothetical protein
MIGRGRPISAQRAAPSTASAPAKAEATPEVRRAAGFELHESGIYVRILKTEVAS